MTPTPDRSPFAPPPVPDPPRPLEPLGGDVVDAQMASFRWTAVEGAAGYRLQVAPDPAFADALDVDAGPSTALTLEGLLAAHDDRPAFWRVRAETPSGPTAWSPYGRFVAGSVEGLQAFHRAEAAQAEAARVAAAQADRARGLEAQLVPLTAREDALTSTLESAMLIVLMATGLTITVGMALLSLFF